MISSMDDASIDELLNKTALGDRRAFDLLYQRTNAKLFALCLRILQDKAEAEDAMQDAYVKIWRYAERYAASRAKATTWMIAITRNHCIDRLRARKTPLAALEAAEMVADTAMRPDQKAMASAEAKRLVTCIDDLGEGDGRLIRTAYFGGVTYRALAERDGTPLGTIKSRMRRALAQLRECLSL